MSMPKDLNDLIKSLIEYQKDNISMKSVNQMSIDIKVNRIYLKGLLDGLYLAGIAEKVVNERQFNSYKIIIDKLEPILNEKKL